MAVLKTKETLNHLLRKGFAEAVNRSDDHKYLEFRLEGKVVLHTKLSHGAKEIGDSLIAQMARQCKLTKSQFMDLAKCIMSAEEYTQVIKDKSL
jgi:predicted RNA binding protein YcfA (HicA-like mRNA interferase family)